MPRAEGRGMEVKEAERERVCLSLEMSPTYSDCSIVRSFLKKGVVRAKGGEVKGV